LKVVLVISVGIMLVQALANWVRRLRDISQEYEDGSK